MKELCLASHHAASFTKEKDVFSLSLDGECVRKSVNFCVSLCPRVCGEKAERGLHVKGRTLGRIWLYTDLEGVMGRIPCLLREARVIM